jgi:hypothetical protein
LFVLRLKDFGDEIGFGNAVLSSIA